MPSVDYDPRRDVDTDLFALLGAEWDADPAAVRQAWRNASRAAHPDAGGSHERFIRMQHAWEVLSDATRRSRYVRAYEARHGPQRRPAGSRGEPSGRRGARTGRPRSGPTAAPCTGTTRDGMPCGNPAAPGSDRCRWHDRSFDDPPPPSQGHAGRAPWRCSEFVTFRGTRLPCHYNRLIGEDRCWDHASDDQRRAAVAAARPGRCAALTQSGRPCRNPRSSLGFPLCDTHLTVGVFRAHDRHGASGQRPPRAPRDRMHPPSPPRDSEPPPAATPPDPDTTRESPRPDPPPGPSAAPPRSARPPTFHPPFAPAGVPYPTIRRHWRRRHVAHGLVATLCVALVVAGVAGIAYRWSQPHPIGFAEEVKASRARCSTDEPLGADDVARGFDLTCTMVDAAPANRDRPYVQVRLEGCDDWQRLDHDDNPEPVTITARVDPCGPTPGSLEWQVCQTHGGLLPDDCDDGATDLPST